MSKRQVWLFTGWEVTTVCSFLLIAYTRTEEAIKNAFRQIIMNLAGGIAFLVALYVMAIQFGTLSFLDFLVIGIQNPALVALPVCALAFAGLTKAAQMPFHTWLLGAMVAPTPTSALLHSSTMVKAGVFLLVKLAPVMYAGTMSAQGGFLAATPGLMVILVGGLTFALCSFLALSLIHISSTGSLPARWWQGRFWGSSASSWCTTRAVSYTHLGFLLAEPVVFPSARSSRPKRRRCV